MSNKDDVLDNILADVPKVQENAAVVDKKNTTIKAKFKPGVGVDIGTSNIVVSRQTEDGTFINRYHRNMLYPLDVSEEAENLLEKSSYLYVKVGKKYYVVGEDALTLVNAIGKGDIVRPMKDGILNPSLKESSELLFYIIKAVVGNPIVPNEPLRYSIPANPIDVNVNNLFHKMVLMSFFQKMGFNPKAVNEGMCIAFDTNPTMKTEEGTVPLSGISCSCGAGMTNIALSFKGMELRSFSITKSGDYIDEQVSKVTGVMKSKVIKRKEKELDLSNLNEDRVLSALAIYYEEYIDRICHLIGKEFLDKSSEIEGEIEIIVAGGSSMPPGFCQKFETAIKDSELPFKISHVRASPTPFYSVAQGASIRAIADYNKSKS